MSGACRVFLLSVMLVHATRTVDSSPVCFFLLHNSETMSEYEFDQLITITLNLTNAPGQVNLPQRTCRFISVTIFSNTSKMINDRLIDRKTFTKDVFKIERYGNGTNVAEAISSVREYVTKTRWQQPKDARLPIIFIVTADVPRDLNAARIESLKVQTEGCNVVVLGLWNVSHAAYVDIASRPEYIATPVLGEPAETVVTQIIRKMVTRKRELFSVFSTYSSTSDIVFALHNSVTVDSEHFQKMKTTIKQLLNNLQHAGRMSVGLITFSDLPRIVRRLRIAKTVDSVPQAIEDIKQTGTGCALESALGVVRGMFRWFTDNKLQRPNLIVVLMARHSDRHSVTVATAEGLRKDGLPLVVIGFGNLTRATVGGIASNDNVLFVPDANSTGLNVADEVYAALKGAAVLPGFDSCFQMNVNLVFVVDVKPAIFRAVMAGLGDHIATTDLGPAGTGLLTFEPDPTEILSCKLTTQRKESNVRATLSQLRGNLVASVNMTSTIEFLRDRMFKSCDRRQEVPQVAIIVTDRVDFDSQDIVQAVKTAREADMHVIAIMVGLNHSDIENMVTDPRGVVTSDSITNIPRALKTAHHLLCPAVCSRSGAYHDGRCYEHVGNTPSSWLSDWWRCHNIGHTLPVITSPDVEDFIRSSFFYWPGTFFIGLRKSAMKWFLPKGEYRWEDRKPTVYSRWAPGKGTVNQPDGSFLELCHYSDVDGWHDVGCAKVVTRPMATVCVSPAGNNTAHSIAAYIPLMSLTEVSNNSIIINGLSIPNYKMTYTFACDTGELTTRHFRCDGVPDCLDGSDEKGCESTCVTSDFKCDNGRCVSYNLYCDFWDDCGDNSDEAGCVRKRCGKGSVACSSGQCVPSTSFCDLHIDCFDGSDEESCHETCSSKHQSCYDGTCIPGLWVGDGITDCAGVQREDETVLLRTDSILANSTRMTWWYSESSAFAGHRCLVVPDGFGRYVLFRGTKHIERPTPFENLTCANSECGPGEFKCPNSYCILSNNVCDSKQDCPYGEDEQGCDVLSCPSFFRCRHSTRCLHLAKVCDGVVDCPLADDERRCGDRCEGRTNCAEGIVSVTPELDLYKGTLVLYQVTRLDFSGHNLSSANFHIADPLDVGHLNVSNCSIKKITREGDFKYLRNLKELDLSHNQHWSIKRAQFWRYQNLQILNLSYNRKLSKVKPKTFLKNPKLKSLNLGNCALKSLYANMFSGLTSLEHLDLSYNRIDFIEDGSFQGVPGLKELLLKGNPVSRFSAGIFDGLVSLELLTTDTFVMCCDEVKPKSLSITRCHAPQNSLSSCKDLMQKDLLRILIWIQGFMALFGNAIVFLYRTIFNRAPLRHPYGQFLLSLCISDFFMGIYLIIIAATDLRFRGIYIWHDSSWRRSVLCQMAGFLSTLSSEASAIFICLVTFDRFLIIRFPFREIYLSTRSSAIATVIGWIVAVAFSIVPLIPGASTWQLYGQNAACLALPLTSERLPGWQYSTAIFIGFNLLTFLLIAVGQYLIYRYLREGSALKTRQRRSQELSVARNLSLVVITDFLCWFPVCIMGLMALNGSPISGEVYAWTAVFVLPVNSAINPILYTLPSIRHLNATICCRKKQPPSRASNCMPDIYASKESVISRL